MAKKQTIILTHGSSIPSNGVISGMNLGEVLVQHGTGATDTMLHTIYQTGNTEDVLVSFPSTKWVEEQIKSVNVNDAVAAIRQDIKNIDDKIDEYSGKTDTVLNELTTGVTQLQAEDIAINGRIDALDEDVSGITASIDALNQTVAENKTIAKEYTDEQVSILKSDVTGNTKDIESIEAKLEGITADTVAEYVTEIANGLDTKINGLNTSKLDTTVYEGKMASVDASLSALTDVVSGYTGVGAIKTAVDSKVDQSVYESGTTALGNRISALESDFSGISDNYVDNDELAATVSGINASIAAAKTVIVENTLSGDTEFGVKVVKETGTNGEDKYTITSKGLASETAVNALSQDLTKLIDVDTNKSVRQIAIQVLSEQLLSGGTEGSMAGESFETLQELAKWLEEHPDSAAAMNEDIVELESTLTGFSSGYTVSAKTSEHDTKISALEADVTTIKTDYLKEIDKTEILGEISDLETGVTQSIDAINAKFAGITADTINEHITGITSDLSNKISALESDFSGISDNYVDNDELAATVSGINASIAAAKTVIVENTLSGDTEFGVKVVKETGTNGEDKYTITSKGLASESAVNALSQDLNTLVTGDVATLKSFMNEVPNVYATITGVSGDIEALDLKYSGITDEINVNVGKKAEQGQVDALSADVKKINDEHIKSVVVENKEQNGIVVTPGTNSVTLNFDSMVIDGGEY